MSEQQTQHENWKAARARIAAAAIKPPAPEKEYTPPPTPNAQPIQLVPISRDVAAEVMDMIVAAVGTAMNLPVSEILAGPPLPELTSARRLAMALSVRRGSLTPARVAEHFEVVPESVCDAMADLDPILQHYVISCKSPLHLWMPIIAKAWNGIAEDSRPVPSMREIQMAVCQIWRIRPIDLCSKCRAMGIVEPRQVAIALCRWLTARSMPEIGRAFGGRDHTTVLHACRKMQPFLEAIDGKMSSLASPAQWARAVHNEIVRVNGRSLARAEPTQ